MATLVEGEEIYKKVQNTFAKFNVPETVYEKMKPWAASNNISSMIVKSTFSPEEYQKLRQQEFIGIIC